MATLSQLDALTQKYQTVFDLMPELEVQVNRVELQGDKLLIRATAPSQEMKRRVWDQITTVDPTYPDLVCRIDVDPGAAHHAVSPALIEADIPAHGVESYVVQPGDTLAKISHLFYGDATQTDRILAENRDQIDDPERLEAGIVLRITL